MFVDDLNSFHIDAVVGGGARERVFWNNYFFHCAFTRYEAGLSIDEIWSYQQESSSQGDNRGAAPSEGGVDGEVAGASDKTEEELVDFDGSAEPTGSAFQELEGGANEEETAGKHIAGGPEPAFGNLNAGNDFELVDCDAADEGISDPELDELEAEIARELEGL